MGCGWVRLGKARQGARKGDNVKEATFRIVGLTPLLQHSTAGMTVEGTGTNLRSKSDNITGREEAEQGCYRDSEGYLVMPTIAFQRTLYYAASGRKVGKTTARVALAGVVMTQEFVRLVDPETDEFIKDFDVDTRFVKVGTARVPRSRARIEKWSVELPVEFDEDLINDGAIRELLKIAGKVVGVGDYRPATGGGPFGRFEVQ